MPRIPTNKEEAELFARQLLRLQTWCEETNTDFSISSDALEICRKIWIHGPEALSDDEERIPKNWQSASGSKTAENQIQQYWNKASEKAQEDTFGDANNNDENAKAAEDAKKAAEDAKKAAEDAKEAAEYAAETAKSMAKHVKYGYNDTTNMERDAKELKNAELVKMVEDAKKDLENLNKAAIDGQKAAQDAWKAAQHAEEAKDANNAKDAKKAAENAKNAANVVKHHSGTTHKYFMDIQVASEAFQKAKTAAKASDTGVKSEPGLAQAMPDTKVKLEYPETLADALALLSDLTLDNNSNSEAKDIGSMGEPNEIYFHRDPFTGLGEYVKGEILFTSSNGKCFGFALPTDDNKFKFGFAPVTVEYENKYSQFQTKYGGSDERRALIMGNQTDLRLHGFGNLTQLQYFGTGYMLPPSGIPPSGITEEDGVLIWTYDGNVCPQTWSVFRHKITGKLAMVSKSLSCIIYKDHFKDKMITYLQDTKIPVPRRKVKKQFTYL